MNVVLHQLRKELRWLWPRWCVFGVALGYDFVVQMRWLFPFAEFPGYGLPSLIYSLPMWVVAWWLLMSVPPEDHGMAFRVTRPLSRAHYWLARALTGVVVVMLPAMMENAAVLLAQGRPWTDAARGMAETGIAVAVMMLWLLPAGTMFRGWEKYAALVLFLYGAMNGAPAWLFEMWGMEHRDSWWVLSNSSLAHRSGACTGVFVLVLAICHLRWPLGRLLRLAVPIVMGFGWSIPSMFPEFPNAIEQPSDEALVKQFTQGREIEIRGVETAKSLESDGLPLRAELRMEGVPSGIAPYWRVETLQITQEGIEVKEAPLTRFDTRGAASNVYALCFQSPLTTLLPASFPPDTLVVMQGQRQNVRLAMLPPNVKPGKPLDLDMHLAADWLRVRELGRMPLKAGATIRTPDNEVEVLEIIQDTDNRHNDRKGVLTLRLLERHAAFAGKNAARPFMPVLCLWAPEKHLVWQQVMTGIDQQRGENHGWMTLKREVTFLWPVLSPGTGVTKENLARQELVWIGGEYLGTSRHQMKLSNVDIGDEWRRKDQWPETPASLTPENPRVAFHEHVRKLPKPDLKAPKAEIARYIAAAYAAEVTYERREDLDDDLKPKWPGTDLEIAQMLAPYFLQQPELLTGTLRKGMRGWHAFTDCVAGEALLLAKVPGVTRKNGEDFALYANGRRDPANNQVMHGKQWPVQLGFAGTESSYMNAIQEALRTGSDDPLWSLEVKPLLTDEETWASFSKSPNATNLRYLAKKPAYRDKAIALTTQEFAHLPRAGILMNDESGVLEAATALGEPVALDWVLRSVARMQDDDGDSLNRLESAYLALFSLQQKKPEPGVLRAFHRDCRKWRATDFRYDAEKMRWELQTNAKP